MNDEYVEKMCECELVIDMVLPAPKFYQKYKNVYTDNKQALPAFNLV